LFLQTKYNWPTPVWESIAWDAFRECACKPSFTTPVTRSKVVHNWLANASNSGMVGPLWKLNAAVLTAMACPRSKEARQTQSNTDDDRQTSGRRRRRKAELVQGYAILRA
jgi:hypothetical protein